MTASRSPPTSAGPARFDQAIADFAETYADQNERDYTAFQAAAQDGRVTVTTVYLARRCNSQVQVLRPPVSELDPSCALDQALPRT